MISQLGGDFYYLIGKSTMGCVLAIVLFMLSCPTLANAKIEIVYGQTRSVELQKLSKEAREKGILELMARLLDEVYSELNPQGTLTLAMAECRKADTFYNRESKKIMMCYEFFRLIDERARKELGLNTPMYKAAVGGAMFFYLFHEFGHAIIHDLNMPITGHEEDVADQLSAFIFLEIKKKEVSKTVVDGMLWYFSSSGESRISEEDFADEHRFDRQRLYNVMCWAYGKDSVAFANLEERLKARARRCNDEYEKMSYGIKSSIQSALTKRGAGSANFSSQQAISNFPQFQVQLNQIYSHPVYSTLRISFDGGELIATLHQPAGLLEIWPLASLPEGKWTTLTESYERQQIPVIIMRRGNSLMAQWTQ